MVHAISYINKKFALVSGLKLEVPRGTGPVGVAMVGGGSILLNLGG